MIPALVLRRAPVARPSGQIIWRLDSVERRKPRILLIEDDMAIALMYQLQLVGDGYDVELATDGVTGLRQVQDATPDLVLLDIRLPRLPGLDVLRAISLDVRLAGVPVVILSNYGEPAMVKEGLALGARDYLIKSQTTPVQLSTLLREHLPPEMSY
jgi:DNA-binding response OmpR family regulator